MQRKGIICFIVTLTTIYLTIIFLMRRRRLSKYVSSLAETAHHNSENDDGCGKNTYALFVFIDMASKLVRNCVRDQWVLISI